ncbi:MAG: hypothetical protein FOGNACKC_02261 [Anaerolineae bacterium]|nr:hypothetical protein [Anaerolineae bacterium]
MARGRMLNNSISLSLKFNQLPDDTCRLLATWTISHLDKNGVFYGLAVSVKSLVMPHRADISVEQVESYLQAMERVGLIRRFAANGLMWQWWPTFTDNQIGLRPERESSDFPEPPSGPSAPNTPPPPDNPPDAPQLPENSRKNGGKNPAQIRAPSGGSNPKKAPEGEVEGESESEEIQMDEESARACEEGMVDEGLRQVSTCWQSEIGFINQNIADNLKSWLVEYPPDMVCQAIQEAKRYAKRPIRSPAYVQTVLDRLNQNQHPAVRVYCQKARRPEPIAELAEAISKAVGDSPDDLTLFGQVLVGYKGLGWNVDNILNILEFFKRREIPQPNQNGKGNGNANHSTSNAQIPAGDRIQKRYNRRERREYWFDIDTQQEVAAPA